MISCTYLQRTENERVGNMKNVGMTLVALAGVAVAGVAVAPSAVAEEAVIHHFGAGAELVNGTVVQEWTVADLKPSSDVIPYPVAGTLWEATATDTAVEGSVIPIVSNFNARARSGQTYRVLFGVATPQGVNPSTLVQGESTTGTIYFDVTGDAPDSVVYNAGGPDLAVWVQPPPAPQQPAARSGSGSAASSGSGAGGAVAAEPAGAEAEEVPAGEAAEAATPVTDGAVVPVEGGSQGTPIEGGSEGTPLPAGDGAAEVPTVTPEPSVAGTQPAGQGSGPAPGPSAGTPLPAEEPGTSAVVAPSPGA